MKQLRKNIRRASFVLILLFAVLVLWGAYSLIVNGNRWFFRPENTYARQKRSAAIEGDIYDTNGILLAATDSEGNRVYQSDLTARESVVHVVGDGSGQVANSVQEYFSTYLYGFQMSWFEKASAFLSGSQIKGDTLQLTIDSLLSAYVLQCIEGNADLPENVKGAVVVMNYQTGEVLCELSLPVFDPNDLSAAKSNAAQPFYNRAIQGLYIPGSTFKIVTLSAALQNGIDPEQTFDCTGDLTVDGHVITDAETKSLYDIKSHGTLTLLNAFKRSCNNTFASIALKIGDNALKKQAQAFGFGDDFKFRDLIVENSSYESGERTDWKIAWAGAGQGDILVTPMHMCMIAASIANGGVMQEPRLLKCVASSSGSVRLSFTSKVYKQSVADSSVIEIVKQAMYKVVNESGGTGQKAAVPGLTIYGKTGSAQIDGQENTNAWFVGFIGDADYPYALAIVLENAGGGGAVAAPIAAQIFEYLKSR